MHTSDVHDYLTEIGRYPVLTKESQLLHCRRIREWVNWPGGREHAPRRVQRLGQRSMDTMLVTNTRLVVSIAKRYQGRGLDLADLIQEGNIGLIRGLELFDPSRGYAVSTYSYWWVRQAITRSIHTHARSIRLPINSHEHLSRIQRFVGQQLALNGTPPSYAAIAEATDSTPERVAQLLHTQAITSCVSLDSSFNEDASNLIDLISDPESYANSEPEEVLDTEANREALHDAMQHLTANEAFILTERYLKERTLSDLSKDIGVTRSRAGQIQVTALRKLRLHLSRRGHTPH